MIKSEQIEKASDVLKSLEELSVQAKRMASNLAYAASKAREAGGLSTRVYDEILDLVDQTGRATWDISRMIRVVRMEVGGLYKLSRHGEIELEKNRELIEKIERSLESVLGDSQRVLYIMKKLKSVAADNKLIS
ncbi:MAG: methyl-accepting chemotaxis protein [candidate division Zixibacteria bacterium]|nr:methyl-accepting chemotaxis protein [candidate division Zixibacteria bacterium]